MALSNWDTLAFDNNGQPGDGKLIIPDGANASIYKNWLYVGHPKMWCEGGGFTGDTVAEVTHGDIRLAGLEIHAARLEEQSAIFAHIKGGHWEHPVYMCGIGCYGFYGQLEYLEKKRPDLFVKLAEEAADELGPEWHSKCVMESARMWGGGKETWNFVLEVDEENSYYIDIEMDPRPDMGDMWCGVKPSTLQAFRDWLVKTQKDEYLDEEYIQKVVATIDANKATRFNQGDHYLSDGPVATPVGESGAPILKAVIDNIFPPKSDE